MEYGINIVKAPLLIEKKKKNLLLSGHDGI